MALPIQPKDTQASCNPVSSNCVIWQGPDIPCITLCRGDSISDVTYKMATELCTLVDQLDIAGFDVSCFPPICPKPENIHDLIQFILDQLCSCCITNPGTGGTGNSSVCPDDCIISIAPCFYYPNQFGDQVTAMTLPEYARAIGTKICDIIDALADNGIEIKDLDDRVKAIENCDPCNPPIPAVFIPVSCLTGGTNILIQNYVQTLEASVCALQNATGTPGLIGTSIAKECINLDTSPTISNPAVNMGTLPGWVLAGSYTTMADAVNNIWLTICDMRAALQNVVNNCCTPNCDAVSITMTSAFSSPNIQLSFAGAAGSFVDCYAAGMFVTITDSFGVSFTSQVPVIANLGGATQSIDISVSALNLYSNYSVSLSVCASDGTTTCNQTINQTIANTALCPAMTYAADVTYIDYSFANAISSPVTYIVECWNNALSAIVSTSTVTNPAAGAVTGTITGLTAATTYQLRVRVIIGSSITDCSYTSVTTKP